jgi:hypothetical protein
MATATLDQALQVFGKLSVEDQEMMLEIARSRRIEAWRKETAAQGKKALADSRAGRLTSYSAQELIERLRRQWESSVE